ncbi:MAG: hypothetical protein R3213_10095, partial [Flavobacteriaceae bacterium]|nr:hypothetical protein [Flavobacteriaceae bacterium]
KEDIVKQLPHINKNYLSFTKFAKASLSDIFGEEQLKNATKKYVYELASCYFENQGNLKFVKHQLPRMAQVSSVFDIASFQINKDPFIDLFLTGNNFEISTQLSRLDASHGEILLFDEKKGFVITQNDKYPISGAVRAMEKITINQTEYLIVARNNASPLFLKLEDHEDEKNNL